MILPQPQSLFLCITAFLLSAPTSTLADTHNNKPPSLENACTVLSTALPGLVTFPNTTLYALENTYWSTRQSALGPACFVTPKTTAHVSNTLKILTSLRQPFSVKGGGHAAFPGASNSDANGVTIDLFRLTTLSISSDRKTVSVGPGNRWINVSTALDEAGLAVVGGRVADVGVGGLILGGGISYFSGARGWACDNVRNYEVVLSSGKVVNASPSTNPDLYWALRGGAGTNFGIVTRFDLVSFEQGPLWYRSQIFPGALNATIIPIFQNLTVKGLPLDREAHTYFVMTHIPALGGFIVLSDQFRSTPLPPSPQTIPPVFQPFNPIPTIFNSTIVANISTISKAIDAPYGFSQLWLNTAVSATSAALLSDFVPLYESYANTLIAKANGTEITPYLIFQPIPTNILQAMQVNGGNTLGLTPSDGPLVIVQLAVTWADSSINEFVVQEAKSLLGKIEALAKKRKLYNGFVYMNYAEPSQDVLGSYGKENLARLRKVARKYDPQGVLQKLWRGYFKLDG
ncbi:hypothetical protein B0H66DRAFT_637348 [Apodospora peruviana]|uniref:FAD-binding PCMH-type domain-containing protein n=1 Tax=Apodospora peruviana TaxID=516989 RepID=A0AAE0IKF6_9PEZI|nr:hypothetical protein B0H66DRAFT_637348 [Apodospora peruviana]